MIALKAAIRDFFFFFFFYNFLTAPHTVSSTYAEEAKAQSCANHGTVATHQLIITCNVSCATWYEGIVELLSFTDFKSHLF